MKQNALALRARALQMERLYDGKLSIFIFKGDSVQLFNLSSTGEIKVMTLFPVLIIRCF